MQVSNAKAAQEGLRMTTICNGCPDIQVSKENLINIQWAIGGLVHMVATGPRRLPSWYARTRKPGTGCRAVYH
jgi:hypothetical protein